MKSLGLCSQYRLPALQARVWEWDSRVELTGAMDVHQEQRKSRLGDRSTSLAEM